MDGMTPNGTLHQFGSKVKRGLLGPSSTTPGSDVDLGTRLFQAETSIPVPSPRLKAAVGAAAAFDDLALTTMGRMNMAGLRPDHDVLDIGCGIGRTARYLCDYLDPRARYEGFDIVEELITWCQENITTRFSNFTFQYTPLFNTHYQRDDSLPSAETFTFPYPDNSFDFVFAHSIFSHLQPDASQNYLREIRRVLRPGGISYSTWMMFEAELTHEPKPVMPEMNFDASGRFAVHKVDVPDRAVAYLDEYVLQLHQDALLTVSGPIHFGYKRMQDVVVATK
jgi:SAM-dependent methyltransferase